MFTFYKFIRRNKKSTISKDIIALLMFILFFNLISIAVLYRVIAINIVSLKLSHTVRLISVFIIILIVIINIGGLLLALRYKSMELQDKNLVFYAQMISCINVARSHIRYGEYDKAFYLLDKLKFHIDTKIDQEACM